MANETNCNENGNSQLANKLSLNLDKVVQLNLYSSASNHQYSINNCPFAIKQKCKYLVLNLDSKLKSKFYNDQVKRFGKQCGKICKVGNCLPSQLLFRYYKSKVNPIIQYGI